MQHNYIDLIFFLDLKPGEYMLVRIQKPLGAYMILRKGVCFSMSPNFKPKKNISCRIAKSFLTALELCLM